MLNCLSNEDVCCGVVFGTLVGGFVFSVMGSELHANSLKLSLTLFI